MAQQHLLVPPNGVDTNTIILVLPQV
jgi:hypothetical protein